MKNITLISFILLNSISISIYAQQNYSGVSSIECENRDDTGPSPAFLYSCNGQHQFCQAFLIFKSQPPYNSIPTISNLMSVNPQELAKVNNNISRFAEFATGKEVIIPVNCSCSGQYYQANTRFIQTSLTYSLIPTQVFQGLSTCSSLMQANPYDAFHLIPGLELKVPLRCACPTKNQTDTGTNYLLTFPLGEIDNVPDIGERFKVSTKSILIANGLTEEDPTLFTSTTILIPFSTQPSSSITLSHQKNNTKQGFVPFRPKRSKSRGKEHAVFAVVAGCAILVLFVVVSISILICKKRKKRLFKRDERVRSERVSPEELHVEIASHVEKVLHVFGFEEIKKATESFSSKNRIKGSVYCGVFGRDTKKLVKKISSTDASKGVNILKKINHFNLIKLEGFCKYHNHLYLVFEYTENGSLKEWLSADSSKMISSWNTRIQIALDIAQGLDYLHSFTKPIYVHKNIKSSNVLLNGEIRAKIANFSLAGEATSQTSSTTTTFPTKHVMGTVGYLAPEYLANGIATSMIDVYAFGVVILELITGKKAVATKDGNRVVLSAAIVSIMEGENAKAELGLFIDSRLEQDHLGLALRLVEISVCCLNSDPENRPTMGEIVSALLKIQTDYQRTGLLDKVVLH